MAVKPPYVTAYGSITKALQKIKTAATPPRFTQDFLATKLQMPGGSPKPVIPFLKRTGFLKSDGSPTDLYERFRNSSKSKAAAAEALRLGYSMLYEVNEYLHDASDEDILGVVVQVTGAEPGAAAVKNTVASFKALRAFADFDGESEPDVSHDESDSTIAEMTDAVDIKMKSIGLSYTINLNLPATSDIKVFDAIFKSLKENLLK